MGVIGHTGRGNYGHGLDTVWQRVPETEVVAVADVDPAGLAAAQQRLGVRGYSDYRAMLAQAKPDIVAVAPRHIDEHRDMTLAAIEAGARGIYMEKPFCRTPAEADEIVTACERCRVKLALAHRNRYHPAVAAVERLLQEGAIGRLLELRGRGKEDDRGGSLDLWVLGSHVFNLIHRLSGAPVACTATVMQGGRPIARADVREGAEGVGPIAGNEVHARFELESGVPAFFDSVQNAGDKAVGFGLQLIGTKGLIDLRMDVEPMAHLLSGSPFKPSTEPRAWRVVLNAPELARQVMSHETAVRDLLAALREDRAPLCSARDGRAIVEMIHAIFESQRLNGQRVEFPLATRTNPLTRLAY
ncbi:MAG: Gfo/Idh/MocA family oxidoreductase [Verrucomicrobia bacterium]|nr:Gfo/Idh/MocA family oxidoreductase [Verrucomicrobiota bacterium]